MSKKTGILDVLRKKNQNFCLKNCWKIDELKIKIKKCCSFDVKTVLRL